MNFGDSMDSKQSILNDVNLDGACSQEKRTEVQLRVHHRGWCMVVVDVVYPSSV